MAMGPLSGVRVLEFGMAVAGPHACKLLALLGAEVIKVESITHLDMLRRAGVDAEKGAKIQALRPGEPLPPGVMLDTFVSNTTHLNKLGITLDMTKPAAVELAKRLVARSDVVVENYRPRVMEGYGLDYPALRETNPKLIMLSTSIAGKTGPEREYLGYMEVFGALGGLGHLTGYPDGPPTWIRFSMDTMSAVTAAGAILAALIYKQRTGEGQYIDYSSYEGAACLIGDALLDYTMNGRNQSRQGNLDDFMAPHNCYRCQGDDKWISIAIGTDEEWNAFCNAIGNPEWTKDERFSDSYSRWQNQKQMDAFIQEWTMNSESFEVMEVLQKAGVAAIPSFSSPEIWGDPHLDERGLTVIVDHVTLGAQPVSAPPWKLSRTSAEITSAGPTLGQHNDYIFGELLGLSKEEISDLVDKGVIR
ncbi:MAG: CoA transferase [Dehalococcoidia bacterium]|nr:MAG: CoA transferase [Dehalococcoidia bacterium]